MYILNFLIQQRKYLSLFYLLMLYFFWISFANFAIGSNLYRTESLTLFLTGYISSVLLLLDEESIVVTAAVNDWSVSCSCSCPSCSLLLGGGTGASFISLLGSYPLYFF